MKLVIVESPAKAKTIAKYLGNDFLVDASGGHICDLPKKSLGIEIKSNKYEPKYEVSTDKKDVIKRLESAVKKAEQVFLATDPDREGEAISWHLQNVLKLEKNTKNRIMFNEITKKAVQESIDKADYINMNLVNAQQARRVLDRLVGYTLSPVLCKKIQPRLSAGRVQSAAVRIIADRHAEIKAFVPEEFWTVAARLSKPNCPPEFTALLAARLGKKLKVVNKEQCDEVLAAIKGKPYIVSNIKKSVTSASPSAPYTTSTMQQDAVNKLHMTSKMCMQLAQNLYEGVEIDGEHIALVTYIRTDSVRVSADAVEACRSYIASAYGADYVPEKPNFYASKKAAQDAHEAIRPINLAYTPDKVKDLLSRGHYNLYKLIFDRFVASQTAKAMYDSVAVTVTCGEYDFKANGRTTIFDGFTRVFADYKTDKDDEAKNADDTDAITKLPKLAEGDALELERLTHEQKFTKPPFRYTESSLIKALEEKGIGRPSTFATIINTLYLREYVIKDARFLQITELGLTVTEYLKKYFEDVVDVEFTAMVEDKLDLIEERGEDWHKIVDDFYKPLDGHIHEALAGGYVKVPDEVSDILCEKCGAPMLIKVGKYGKYLACSAYPACENRRSLKEKAVPVETDILCDKCGAKMLERESKYGKYLSCSGYPQCKNIKPLNEIAGKCPKCGSDVAKRKSKRGKIFFGCTAYPKCDFVTWDAPKDGVFTDEPKKPAAADGEKPKCGAKKSYSRTKK